MAVTPKRIVPATVKLAMLRLPFMVVPIRVAFPPIGSPSFRARSSLIRISPAARGRRPRTMILARSRSPGSGLPGEKRSTARPAAGAWMRVSPLSSGTSRRPPKSMRASQSMSGWAAFSSAASAPTPVRASSLGSWATSLA